MRETDTRRAEYGAQPELSLYDEAITVFLSFHGVPVSLRKLSQRVRAGLGAF